MRVILVRRVGQAMVREAVREFACRSRSFAAATVVTRSGVREDEGYVALAYAETDVVAIRVCVRRVCRGLANERSVGPRR